MRAYKLAVVLFLVAILQSCGIFKRIPDKINVRDSTSIQYKDSTVIKDSIVYVPVPVENVVNVTMPNQTSYLTTSLAESTAYTDSLGFLHHNLKNRSNEKIPVIVFNKEFYHTAKATASKSETIIRTVQVEKKLNWWQRFRLKSFWWLLAVLLIENVILIFAIRKRFIFK